MSDLGDSKSSFYLFIYKLINSFIHLFIYLKGNRCTLIYSRVIHFFLHLLIDLGVQFTMNRLPDRGAKEEVVQDTASEHLISGIAEATLISCAATYKCIYVCMHVCLITDFLFVFVLASSRR